MVSEVRPEKENVDVWYLAHLKVGSVTHGVASHAGDAHLRPADHTTVRTHDTTHTKQFYYLYFIYLKYIINIICLLFIM